MPTLNNHLAQNDIKFLEFDFANEAERRKKSLTTPYIKWAEASHLRIINNFVFK